MPACSIGRWVYRCRNRRRVVIDTDNLNGDAASWLAPKLNGELVAGSQCYWLFNERDVLVKLIGAHDLDAIQ